MVDVLSARGIQFVVHTIVLIFEDLAESQPCPSSGSRKYRQPWRSCLVYSLHDDTALSFAYSSHLIHALLYFALHPVIYLHFQFCKGIIATSTVSCQFIKTCQYGIHSLTSNTNNKIYQLYWTQRSLVRRFLSRGAPFTRIIFNFNWAEDPIPELGAMITSINHFFLSAKFSVVTLAKLGIEKLNVKLFTLQLPNGMANLEI